MNIAWFLVQSGQMIRCVIRFILTQSMQCRREQLLNMNSYSVHHNYHHLTNILLRAQIKSNRFKNEAAVYKKLITLTPLFPIPSHSSSFSVAICNLRKIFVLKWIHKQRRGRGKNGNEQFLSTLWQQQWQQRCQYKSYGTAWFAYWTHQLVARRFHHHHHHLNYHRHSPLHCRSTLCLRCSKKAFSLFVFLSIQLRHV